MKIIKNSIEGNKPPPDFFTIYLQKQVQINQKSAKERLLELENFLLSIDIRLKTIAQQLNFDYEKLHLIILPKKIIYSDAGAFGLSKKNIKKICLLIKYLSSHQTLRKEIKNLYFFRQIVSRDISYCKKYARPKKICLPQTLYHEIILVKKSA